MIRLSVTILFAALPLSACDRQPAAPAQESRAVGVIDRGAAGTPVPDVTLVRGDGETLALGKGTGRPMLVNLWATWCAPCVKEMPLLDRLAADYDGRLDVIAASQDLDAEAIDAFFAENDLPHLDPWHDAQTRLSFAVGAGLPITVLYDEAGRETWRIVGDADWGRADIRAAIDEVL